MDMTSEAVKRIEDVRFVRAVQVNEITKKKFWVINIFSRRLAHLRRLRRIRVFDDLRRRGVAVSRGQRPDGPPDPTRELHRDGQLLHLDCLQKGRRGAGSEEPLRTCNMLALILSSVFK